MRTALSIAIGFAVGMAVLVAILNNAADSFISLGKSVVKRKGKE